MLSSGTGLGGLVVMVVGVIIGGVPLKVSLKGTIRDL